MYINISLTDSRNCIDYTQIKYFNIRLLIRKGNTFKVNFNVNPPLMDSLGYKMKRFIVWPGPYTRRTSEHVCYLRHNHSLSLSLSMPLQMLSLVRHKTTSSPPGAMSTYLHSSSINHWLFCSEPSSVVSAQKLLFLLSLEEFPWLRALTNKNIALLSAF